MQRVFDLWLDRDTQVQQYYIYRSSEQNSNNGNPVVDGLYVWRPELGENPPKNMKLTLEWTDNQEKAPVTQD